jgi:hypothetical protein
MTTSLHLLLILLAVAVGVVVRGQRLSYLKEWES